MTPSPYLQLLCDDAANISTTDVPSAAFVLSSKSTSIDRWQVQADAHGLALILPGDIGLKIGRDGFWFQEAGALKAARKQQPGVQMVGLATDRHEAMVMGEAGADLILFGCFQPIRVAGNLEMAQWWALMFEVPCACLRTTKPEGGFGGEGEPEFFAV